MADAHPTPAHQTAHPSPQAGQRDRTLWRQGLGVGAAIGTAIIACIAVGLRDRWEMLGGTQGGWALGMLAVGAGTVAGAVIGALIGWSVPVAETKQDTQIGIH
jgi:hypothetical protein